MLSIADYDYVLPPSLVATSPCEPRDSCRLLGLDRQTGHLSHSHFYDLSDLFRPTDVLVLNQTKVFPARLFGHKSTGGRIEVLLLESVDSFVWRAIARPGLKKNTIVSFDQNLCGKVLEFYPQTGEIDIEFNQKYEEILITLEQIGNTPIPPYINSSQSESDLRSGYQTVFARSLGSAAAPTAGLHFTTNLLRKIKNKGIAIEFITLHVGLGTFQKLRPTNLSSQKLHSEKYTILPEVSKRLSEYKKNDRRIIAVGTTSVRALESYAISGKLSGNTEIFIHPPYQFKIIDSLITNFHLPKSSLLMLVTAFCGAPTFRGSHLENAYQQAILSKYKFFSFGDAMWIY